MKRMKLGEVARYVNGRAFKPSEWCEKGVPIIRIQNLNDGSKPFNYFAGLCEDRFKVFDGDLLVSWSASLGAFIWNRGEALLNQHIFKVIPDEGIVRKKYLYFAMRSLLQEMERHVHGATMQHITKDRFENIELNIPDFAQQDKYVYLLEKAEAALTKRRQALALTDEFLKSTFLDLFGDPITNSRGWPQQIMGDVLDVRDGTHDTPKYCSAGIPLITSKNLINGGIDFSNVQYISENDHVQIQKRSFVEQGDILFGMIGTIGSPSIVETDRPFSIKNVALFKFKNSQLSNIYIKHLFSEGMLIRTLLEAKRGGTQKFVSLKTLRDFKIPIPSIDKQEIFAGITRQVSRMQGLQRASEQELQRLFPGTMATYLTVTDET